MRKTIGTLIATLLLFVLSCGNNPTKEQLAAMAAQGYYQHLQQGDIDNYLAGTAGYDSLPEGYKSELKVNMKMFLARQKAEHGDIIAVETSNAKADSTLNVVYALLNIQFADSTREEISVPMVEHQGRWVMK